MKKTILCSLLAASVSMPAMADHHSRRGFGIGLGYASVNGETFTDDTGVAIDLNWTFANGLTLGEMIVPNAAGYDAQFGGTSFDSNITMATTYIGYETRSGLRYKGGVALTYSEATVETAFSKKSESDLDVGALVGVGYVFDNDVTADVYYMTGSVDRADWDFSVISLNIGYKFSF